MGKIHLLGNGDSAHMFNKVERNAQDKLLICNHPPFEVRNVFATCIVDFKMMNALFDNSLNLDMYPWVLGNRPKIFLNKHNTFYIHKAANIKEFYLDVPKYAVNATNFNCGHMAAHYAANKLKADEVHLYGFDSMFDHNMKSITDFLLPSDRGNTNNYRLLHIWRPIWTNIFKQFRNDTKFILHHPHSNIKIDICDNVEIVND